jgi:hypothetical protein
MEPRIAREEDHGRERPVAVVVAEQELPRVVRVRMASEELYLSMDAVRVTYRFENLTDEEQRVLVAFPMPGITGDFYSDGSYPTDDPENIFGFSTTFDGVPVEAELHQYAFALGVNRTKELQKYGLPLAPHVAATEHAVNALPEADAAYLAGLGLLENNGWGDESYYTPIWTMESAYTWEAVFPPSRTVVVEHAYTPGIGGTSMVSFLSEESRSLARYVDKYCLDDPVINAVKRNLVNPDELWSAPYYESWLSYVLSTGENWAGSIGEFRLIVDKGRPENFVSFCGENVVKTSPTTFEITETDFYPWGDIHVLFLNRINTD